MNFAAGEPGDEGAATKALLIEATRLFRAVGPPAAFTKPLTNDGLIFDDVFFGQADMHPQIGVSKRERTAFNPIFVVEVDDATFLIFRTLPPGQTRICGMLMTPPNGSSPPAMQTAGVRINVVPISTDLPLAHLGNDDKWKFHGFSAMTNKSAARHPAFNCRSSSSVRNARSSPTLHSLSIAIIRRLARLSRIFTLAGGKNQRKVNPEELFAGHKK